MKTLTLPKEHLDFFGSVLQQFGEMTGPVAHRQRFAFRRLDRWSEIRLDYPRTILPLKKYFLPPRERLFRYRRAEGYVPETADLERRIVLFGVHACDIYGLNILAQAFGGRYPDPVTVLEDRPGADRRYAIDSAKIRAELSWRPQESFESGLEKTVRWYLANRAWTEDITSGAYRSWVEQNYGTRGRA